MKAHPVPLLRRRLTQGKSRKVRRASTPPTVRVTSAKSPRAALAILATLLMTSFNGFPAIAFGAPVEINSIAVLPLANLSGDPEQDYFVDGMTDALITGLAKTGDFRVIARGSVMRYKNTSKPLPEIAAELGVDALLEGSAMRTGDSIRLSVRLIDPATRTHLWAESYDRPLAGLLQVSNEVGLAVARQIRGSATSFRQTSPNDTRQINPAVYEAYLRGMFYVSQNTPEGFEKGLEHLQRAVELDPAEPLAYAGLAQGYIALGHDGGERLDIFPRARAAAEQALKLDPDMAEAVSVLANVAMYYEWDWEKAESLFRRALALNPSLAATHYHYAWYLALFDRLDEAIEEHEIARELDVLQPAYTAWLGHLYNYAGRYDEAIFEVQKALELNSNFGPCFLILSFAYSKKGMHGLAIAAAQRLVELRSDLGNALLAAAYARAGREEEALSIASELDESNKFILFDLPQIYAALGDSDTAIRLLEVGYEARNPFLPWIRVQGGPFSTLHKDPRFEDLLRRMNLPRPEEPTLPVEPPLVAQESTEEIQAPDLRGRGDRDSLKSRVYRPVDRSSLLGMKLYDRSHAVVIGISNYDELLDLPGAASDARAVAAALEKRGFETTLLLDEEATRARVAEVLGDRFPLRVRSNDRVLVYFAGHGLTVGSGDYAMGYLMPVEGRSPSRVSTGISMSELQRWFSAYPSKHVMFVADACYSGLALSTRSAAAPAPDGVDSGVLSDYLRQVTQSKVRLALTAGRDTQESHEWKGHGLFTYFFLEALDGAADVNHDGIVTASELYAYIEPNVAQTALANWRAQQNPQMGRSGQGEFIFLVPSR